MDVLEGLLFNLQTITNIPKGKKINTGKEFICVDTDNVLQPIIRWKQGDCRDKALHAICGVIRTTIYIAGLHLESKNMRAEDSAGCAVRRLLNKICNQLAESCRGLDNLCVTYANDANFVAHITLLRNEIKSQCDTIKCSLSEFSESTT